MNGTCAYQGMSEILLEHTYFSVKQFLKNKINYLKSRFEGANIFYTNETRKVHSATEAHDSRNFSLEASHYVKKI